MPAETGARLRLGLAGLTPARLSNSCRPIAPARLKLASAAPLNDVNYAVKALCFAQVTVSERLKHSATTFKVIPSQPAVRSRELSPAEQRLDAYSGVRKMRISKLAGISLSLLLLVAPVLWGQAVSTSQISGVVQDPTGANIPGANVKVTQVTTGLVRATVTNTDGTYVLPNLPVGPYQLTVSKEGFNAYVQNGIVLQVSTNPVINVELKIGSVSETVEVQAGAAMAETQTTAVGQVIDERKIVELPLNGRQATSLIFLAGAATTAPAGDLNTNKNYPTVTISVSGGLPNGMSYLLDGGTHNDPFNNLNLPIPFPDALQEFKVETSSLPARYGQHASAAVNTVTKSGTNQIHGDLFEFVRNYVFNARDYFATQRDSLKRNQYGGTIGGPLIHDKMFYFAGYQGTIERSNPPTTTTFVPTAQMLSGDFTTFASAACQGSNKTLTGGFVGNKISPTQFNQAALNVLKFVPVSTDPCGKLQYGIVNNNREYQVIGRLDYNFSQKHSLYGRYFIGNYNNPVTWDNKNVLLANKTGVADQDQTLTLGDTYTLNPTTISSTHATLIRTRGLRVMVPYFAPKDVGVNVFGPIPGFMGISVTGGFTIGAGATNPGYFNSTGWQLAEDIDLIRGKHQLSIGVSWIHSIMNTLNNRPSNGQFSFSGQNTGLGYSDFLLGKMSSFVQGNPVYDYDRSNYIGVYAQDSWRVNPRVTLNYGLRWEPFLPETNSKNYVENFDINRFTANVHSTVNPTAPAGLLFPGDPGYPGSSNTFGNKKLFAPRAGVIWDPSGNGQMTIRASYGIFFDSPQLFFFTRVANNPPWGAQVSLTNPSGGFSNPYLGQAGGNPFPGGSFFPLNGVYVTAPLHMKPTYLEQWNLSIQRQVGQNLLLSATYIGNNTIHLMTGTELNPAVFGPGATLSNTNARRVLTKINPSQGQFYSTIGAIDDGGSGNYNGLLLAAQRRFATHFSALANWTYSHCISDPETTEITGPTYVNPANRELDRSNCSSDRRQLTNISIVAESPHFDNTALDRIAANWQLSPIIRYSTGNFSTIQTGADNALTGITPQRPVQLLADVFLPNKGPTGYLNPAAFGIPVSGTLSTMKPLSVLNPGQFIWDMALSRSFSIRERQKIQFRWEIFNVLNHANLPAPGTSIASSSTFGKMTGPSATGPRIMQLALKYVF